MRAMVVLCVTLLVGMTGAKADVDTSSANWLMPGCRAFISDSPDATIPNASRNAALLLQGLCAGNVEGVWDTAFRFGEVCSPEGAINEQAVRVVVQYIDARPARMQERFAGLALEALIAAWPCK
jgi:hypothetical protein